MLLCGYTPFSDQDNASLMASIKSGIIDFPSPDCDSISENVKDLIRNCLKVDPKDRLTCDQILAHKWLIEECDKQHMGDCHDRVKKYAESRV